MKTPPIPDSPHFATQHGVVVYLNPRAESLESWPIKYAQPYERSIIAAVARCAWLDAALKLSNNTFERKEEWRLSVRRLMREEWTLAMATEEIALGAIDDEELQMKYHAEAWRIWGKQK